MMTYEQRLNQDSAWALKEGGMHFSNQSAVHHALDKVAKRLDESGIAYAIVGAMALFVHGYRRFTEDVDILVDAAGLEATHHALEGLGYGPLFEGSRGLRDAENGVRIEFLVAGEFPGDGKPKPVAFPRPEDAAVEIDGRKYVPLPKLIELKLASGSAPHRLKDLADVQETIKTLGLPLAFADNLDASVRTSWRNLWEAVHNSADPPQ